MEGGEFNKNAECFVNEEWIPCTGVIKTWIHLSQFKLSTADSSGPKLAPGLQSSPVTRRPGFNLPLITFVAGR